MSCESPLISVILPAFNSAPYLSKAIESILSQTFGDFELLVIYDESSDQTLQIIEDYLTKDGRIRLIFGRKARLVGALNQGLDFSKGQFIARMDADDFSLPTRFEKQLQQMDIAKLDFCGSNITIVNANGEFIKEVVMPSTPDLITITLACTVPFAHGSVMMRKQFIDQHTLRYIAGTPAEDYDFWCRSYRLGARFGNVDENLFFYRYSPESLSNVYIKLIHQHTREVRRNFVKSNINAMLLAIKNLALIQNRLSVRDENFLILATYLVFLKTNSKLLFTILKNAHLKSSAIALAKIVRGF